MVFIETLVSFDQAFFLYLLFGVMITYGDFLEQKQIDTIVRTLEAGGIIIIPTDSFYCFVCDINNHKAAQRLASLKNKKIEKASFSILCSNISQASEYTKPLTKEQFITLKKNTPGAFTFIFQASNKVPKIFLTKKRTIGIRIPNCKIATQIAEAMQRPLLISSVNHLCQEEEDYANGELLEEKYIHDVEFVVESDIPSHLPSTVVDYTDQEPQIVRQGMATLEL